MTGGREGEHLLAVVRELHEELGYSEASGRPEESWTKGPQAELWEACEIGEEGLVAELREELAKLGWAALDGAGEREGRAVRSALDGAELVMSSEIAGGRAPTLARYLPGFAFLVTLPGLGRKRAMEVSERAEKLLEGAGA